MRIVTRETVFHHGIGLPPGEVVPLESDICPDTEIRLMAYGEADYLEKNDCSPDELIAAIGQHPVSWIHISGVSDHALITDFCARLGVHALAIEDILNTEGRPKIDEFDDDLFVLTRAGLFKEDEQAIYMEQVTFYLGDNFLVSVQESNEKLFDPIVRRIRKGGGRIRQRGHSYLLFALMDVKNDFMMDIVDEVEDDIVAMEQGMLECNSDKLARKHRAHETGLSIETIYHKKRAVLALMRILLPIRDNANRLEQLDHIRLAEEDRFYFRDLADSSRRAVDRMDHHRIILQTMQEFYHLEQEHRTNEVMKVLTIIATLFLPLTFIAGVYGMNFDHSVSKWNMPELYWKMGYPICLGFMAAVFIAFLVYFRRKKWI
ncbi:magnesium/cobalt transporter CorA [Cerasicoccus arenae]|uniref:Magnesium transport protein CorA n=1 Tax=Cerasicoccus arenae TaxID=424488 RepID=A0A8J3GEW3_9BACT|nr:magnesium/cobalt transporter CorA [Cerasicoccus arenae]MBK1858079.1 magnesium/cobalt transporter CorA [Cerasicoccus arenae]GHC06955.1 magnesium transport protein CorA [Cerasicoccus arenae]